jgi:hypothetical protein
VKLLPGLEERRIIKPVLGIGQTRVTVDEIKK